MRKVERGFAACLVAFAAMLGWAGASAPAGPAPGLQAMHVPLAARAPLIALALAGKRVVAVGDYGIVVLSDDAGASWRQARSVATRDVLTAVTFVDPSRGFAVGHGGVVLRTDDAGESWQRVYAGRADTPFLAVWFEDARHGIAVGAFGTAIETTDGGEHWHELAIGEGDNRDRHLNGIVGLRDGTLLVTAESGTLFRSPDRGRTWTAQSMPYNGSLWGGLALRDGSVLVYGMRGHVLRSTDQGRTFVDVPTGTNQSLTAAAQLADGSVVLVGLSGTVLRTRDGASFSVDTRPERQTFTAVAEVPGRIVLASTSGIVNAAALR